jgi:hypothetical protein
VNELLAGDQNETDLIVIPSINDPTNTLRSIAALQNAFDINPPIPILVLYGSCPNANRALGEGGKEEKNWPPRWPFEKFKALRTQFQDIADHNGMTIYFLDDATQEMKMWNPLNDAANGNDIVPPQGVTRESFIKVIDEIFGATYSYGAQRNKAFMVACNLNARRLFFFDDDTFLAPHVGNMIERHSHLLDRPKVAAVTGGYFGQRAFNATIFRKIDEQQEFMELLGYDIPDDQSTQDLWGWRVTNGVLGGNFCVKREVYQRICCPSMHRTPTTDDKLVGREIKRLMPDNQIYKTGWPVLHIHFPDRMKPDQVKDYLRSWAKTKAFWRLYNGTAGGTNLEPREKHPAAIQKAEEAVAEFGIAVGNIAQKERKQAPGKVTDAIAEAADIIQKDAPEITRAVFGDMVDFEALKTCWETILDAVGKLKLWSAGGNVFRPRP